MKKQFLFLFVLSIFLITLVSAESIGEFQLGSNIEIYQTCNNCTFCDFTRIVNEDDSILLSNVDAVKDGTYYSYNITAANFSKVGDYSYCYNCGNVVENKTGCIDFEITYTGGRLTGTSTSVYFMSIFILLFLFVLVIIFARQLPSKDASDEAGTIIQISNLKHLRPVLYGIAWAIILALIFTVSNITIAYLPTFMFGNLFFNAYKICFWMTIIAIPLWFIWIFTGIFRDKEMKRLISRGVELKTF